MAKLDWRSLVFAQPEEGSEETQKDLHYPNNFCIFVPYLIERRKN